MSIPLYNCLYFGFIFKIPGRVFILPSFLKLYRSTNCQIVIILYFEFLSSVFNSKRFHIVFMLYLEYERDGEGLDVILKVAVTFS